MNTSTAIYIFKQCCKDPLHNDERKLSVETQHNRTDWELNHPVVGKLRLSMSPRPTIVVFPSIKYAADAEMPGTFIGNLSQEEAKYLKKLYFGSYKRKK